MICKGCHEVFTVNLHTHVIPSNRRREIDASECPCQLDSRNRAVPIGIGLPVESEYIAMRLQENHVGPTRWQRSVHGALRPQLTAPPAGSQFGAPNRWRYEAPGTPLRASATAESRRRPPGSGPVVRGHVRYLGDGAPCRCSRHALVRGMLERNSLRDVDQGLLRNDRWGGPQSVTAGSLPVTPTITPRPFTRPDASVPSVRGTGPSTATRTGAVAVDREHTRIRTQPPHRLTRGQRASQGARQTPQPSKRASREVR